VGKLTTSHRYTIYPCCVPTLGDLRGAGRVGLTQRKSSCFRETHKEIMHYFEINIYILLQSSGFQKLKMQLDPHKNANKKERREQINHFHLFQLQQRDA